MISTNVADLAWLAGIIDGEGSIFVMKQKRNDRDRDINFILRVSVDSTDPYMTPACQEIAGGPCVTQKRDKRPECSDGLKWQVNGKYAIKVLEAILPYLRVKKHQALLAIEFQKTTKKHWKRMTQSDYEQQEIIYNKLKEAKRDLKIGKLKDKI